MDVFAIYMKKQPTVMTKFWMAASKAAETSSDRIVRAAEEHSLRNYAMKTNSSRAKTRKIDQLTFS